MMQRVWSVDLPNHIGRKVVIAGWLLRLRRLSQVSFVIVRDGRGLAQAVLGDPALVEQVAALQSESVVRIEGEVVATAQAPRGVELRVEKIDLISAATEPPPFELHRPEIAAQLPTFLDHAAVGLRHPRHRAMFRLAAASVDGFRRALRAEHFVEIFTPKLVATATEGGANVFAVDYFGRPAYLAQSPQFYKQTMVGVFERVFEVGPVFRAEPHDTPRHLNQYASLDAEMGFIDDHTTVMALLERTIAGMLNCLEQEAQEELALLGCELPKLPKLPERMPVLDFVEAQQLIQAATGEDVLGEPDLAPSHERWLGEWATREHGSEFLFVTGYPLAKRPFYTHPDPTRPGQSNSFDLLFRGLELVTGGQRLHIYTDYLAALAERGQNPEPMAGYLEAFKHGMPPHGGFAMGLERWVARLVGAANVRETTLFPRDMQRLTP
jgi:nondiscriminating aspartyl-tRNA synthetase